ncbi:MAG TPA: immunoglobulin domain-containing protein [Verrucomicrobiae bacterium]
MKPNKAFSGEILSARTCARAAVLAFILAACASRATGFFDGFEGFARGILDATYSLGPNAGGNGGTNPWFSSAAYPAAGMEVVATEYSVAPHGGTNMIRAQNYNALYGNNVEWYNLSYRCAGGGIYYSNLVMEWWFYDPLGGGGGGDYLEYVALCNYDGVAPDLDYYWWPTFLSQRLSLGAYMPGTGSGAPMYQARVVGATDAVNPEGWFYLTNATRSIGWHHARIVIGAENGADTPASFFIDDMITPALIHAVMTNSGFNLLEVNGDYGNTTGYFDDFVFQDNALAPRIGTGPTNLTVNAGANASFAVTGVTGNPAPFYFWQKNGAPLADGGRFSGVNSPALTILSTVETDAGNYSCLASNIAGAVVGTATLTLIVPPTLDSQTPPGGTVFVSAGGTATFSVNAHASNPINYQWNKGGTPLVNGTRITGATTASLTITGVDATDAGSYSCHLSNAEGATDSASVALVLASAPTINSQPTDQTVATGATASFTVSAAGTSLYYQWSKGPTALNDGARVSGANTSALSISSVTASDAGSYSCLITNGLGSTNTATATLTVIDPPAITTQPVSQVASNGSTVEFDVVATGISLTYQWKKNGAALSNAGDFSGVTTPVLTIHVTSLADEGVYTVTVTNVAGSTTSAGAALRLNQAVFSFFDDFESYATGLDNAGGRVGGTTLDYNYGNNPSATCPWWGSSPPNFFTYPAGTDGATPYSGNLMIGAAYTTVTRGDNDETFLNLSYRFNNGQRYYGNLLLDWQFYDPGTPDYGDQFALANFTTNMPSGADSTGFLLPRGAAQRLFLGAWPNLDTNKYQASIIGVSDGTAGIFSRNIAGTTKYFNTTAARSQGWHHARILVGPPDPGTHAANARFYVDDMVNAAFAHDLPIANVGFNSIHLLACSIFAPATSETAGFFDDVSFRTVNDPYIVQQPFSRTNDYRTTATFTVVAMGTSYQWQKDGSALPGSTNATLTLNSVTGRDQGTYTCIVGGANGSLTSEPATLTVVGAPPLLSAALVGQKVVITWIGPHPLLSSTDAAGPYVAVAGARSPYTNTPVPGSRLFFGLGQ